MGYQQATWIDRDSEHPNRRTLTNINDPTDVKTYDISRAEGTVTTPGTPLTAANMNDLESRIASAFTEVNNNMPEANPSGEATDELEKLKVGNTIYSVEGAKPETATIQNTPIASFSDGADNVPVSELIVDITATQAGSGTPSPYNPRLISGHSSCTITVEDDIDDPQEVKTVTISLGDTYYGGTLNVTTGELTVTPELVNLKNLNWGKATNTNNTYFYVLYSSGANGSYNTPATNILCSTYNSVSRNVLTNTAGTIGIDVEPNAIYIADSQYDSYTTTQFAEAMENVQLVVPLSTPTTVQLTPTEVRTLLNCNIFADTGDINELVYFKTGCEAIARLIEAYGIETEVAGTLTAGQTSITLTNNAITTNSTIDVFTDADVDYNSISVSTGSVTITFDAQANNMNVKVRIS